MTTVTATTPATSARGEATRLREDVENRVAEGIEKAPDAVSDIYIGWFAAADAVTCPAKYRADGAHGWSFPGWSPALAAAAVARAALGHHLHQHHRPTRPASRSTVPLPDPAGAVRTWMHAAASGESRPPVAEWIADRMAAKDRAALAATAATASRWLGGFVRVLGWPLPDDLGIVTDDHDSPVAFRWQKKYRISRGPSKAGGPVTIAGNPDAVLGRVTGAGTHTLVIHRPSAPTDSGLAERAAFEATAAAAGTGVVPAEVLFTLGDTGERTRLTVDSALLERGAEMIAEVVRQRIIAECEAEADSFTDASPSPACRFCDHLDQCRPGRAWLDDPTRLEGGLPVLRNL